MLNGAESLVNDELEVTVLIGYPIRGSAVMPREIGAGPFFFKPLAPVRSDFFLSPSVFPLYLFTVSAV